MSQGINLPDESERSPLLARRGDCGGAAVGVVGQDPKNICNLPENKVALTNKGQLRPADERREGIRGLMALSEYKMGINPVIEPPPRRFAPPLLARRGDSSNLPSILVP